MSNQRSSGASSSKSSSQSDSKESSAVRTKTTETTTTYWVDGKDGKLPWPWAKIAGPALLASAVLVGASTLWAVPRIENKLEAATRADLEAQGIDTSKLKIDYSYRNGTITGEAAEGVSVGDIKGAVSDDGIRNLDASPITNAVAPEPEPEPEPEPQAPATGPVDVLATVDGESVVLTGEVLSQAQHDSIVAAAVGRFGEANVTNELTISGLEEASAGSDERTNFLAATLSNLPAGVTGSAAIDDAGYDFQWDAPDAAAGDGASSAGGAAPAGYNGSINVVVPEAVPETQVDDLQAEFDELAVEIRETVVFATNSDVLVDGAKVTLDKVVTLMDQYDLPVVEISGHTDSDGDAGFNQELSQKRAQSVVNYLISSGLAEDRLTARGAGEDEPISSNDTPEGRAENRRVELVASVA